MSLPQFVELSAAEGEDTVEKWRVYLEALCAIYYQTLVKGNLVFQGKVVNYRRSPESRLKPFGFWHLIQEGFPEEERTPDLERCRRILWVSWVIKNVGQTPKIRLVLQSPRHGEKKPWALWLYEEEYAVIVAERKDHCLLKTAFMVKSGKRDELQRDWQASQRGGNG